MQAKLMVFLMVIVTGCVSTHNIQDPVATTACYMMPDDFEACMAN